MKTLESKFEISGIGLMSGVDTTLEICPSDTKGIKFHNGGTTIIANCDNVVSCEHCVVLGNKEELQKANNKK